MKWFIFVTEVWVRRAKNVVHSKWMNGWIKNTRNSNENKKKNDKCEDSFHHNNGSKLFEIIFMNIMLLFS